MIMTSDESLMKTQTISIDFVKFMVCSPQFKDFRRNENDRNLNSIELLIKMLKM